MILGLEDTISARRQRAHHGAREVARRPHVLRRRQLHRQWLRGRRGDSLARPRSHLRSAPEGQPALHGPGQIDFPAIIDALADLQFKRWAVLETSSPGRLAGGRPAQEPRVHARADRGASEGVMRGARRPAVVAMMLLIAHDDAARRAGAPGEPRPPRHRRQRAQVTTARASIGPRKSRSRCSRCPRASRSRCGQARTWFATRPTSTSTATAASGWPRACATASTTPASPPATASSCSRTPTATGAPTPRTPSCRNRRSSRRSAWPSSTTRIVVSQPPDLIVYTDVDRNLRFDPAVDTPRGAAHGIPGHQPRPLAAFGDRRPRRQVALQLGQHGRAVHGPLRTDVHVDRALPCRSDRALDVAARRRKVGRHAQRRWSRLRRRLHGPDEPRRHAGRRSSGTTSATATSSRSRRSATSSRATTTTRPRAA